MNSNNIRIVLVLTLLLTAHCSKAQQDPLYSQYMFNIQAYNPAYAGSWNKLGIMALGRNQWVGFEGAPSTYTLTAQAPLNGEKIGAGLSIINDKIGFINRFSVFMDYAYKLNITDAINLRLGLKGGLTNYQHNFDQYSINDQDDPLFALLETNLYLLNFGLGAFLHAENFYLGASIPKILKNELGNNTNNVEISYVSFIGGYVQPINENLKFKPSVHFRYLPGSISVTDINASFLLLDKIWLGGLYRISNAFGFGVNANIKATDKLRIGYAFDFMNSSLLNTYNTGSHEIMVSYELNLEKTSYQSPRYF